jgi:FkbM family methyltransferase
MYSQNAEEEIILKYFGGKVGSYISIGENDGITLSNVRKLAELGWTGVNVEPSPTAFKMLIENTKHFKNVKNYNFALGTTNGNVKFFDSGSHLGNGDHGLVSTMVFEERNRWKKEHFTEIEVKCFRWKTFLNRLSVKEFDFISMDIEGMEIELLKQMDLRTTSLVCLEWNSKPEVKAEFDKLMIGFNIIYTSPENLIYAR